MKTKLSLTLTAMSGIIILNQFKAIDDLLLLFLVGAIPGTDTSVPPAFMMAGFVAAAALAVIRLNRYQPE